MPARSWSARTRGRRRPQRPARRIRRRARNAPYFEVGDAAIVGVTGDETVVRCTLGGEQVEIRADFAAGCDGFHGISRRAIPAGALTTYQHTFPFGWLGILAEARPVGEELVYNTHERGFTLHSMRSPSISRQYLQVGPDADLADWPDDRIWAELRTRLVDSDQRLTEGPILEKSITAMRAMVCEPMQYGRLLLAGDAAHIVPPSAAKGLNLAVADARALAEAFALWYAGGNREPLDDYSRTRLNDVWRAQEFSAWMTQLLHNFPGESAFEAGLRRARLRNLVTVTADAVGFAGNYVGLSRLQAPTRSSIRTRTVGAA